MNTQHIEKKIKEAGHRVKISEIKPVYSRINRITGLPNNLRPFDINVRRDKKGEYFTIRIRKDVQASVLSVEGDHALLMFKDGKEKMKALIGHDERQLFIAAIPEKAGASTVHEAKQALKPARVLEAEKGTKGKHRHKRKTDGRKRQGDFWFLPASEKVVKSLINREDVSLKTITLEKEPISRGSGASHICDKLVRLGGEIRYFHFNLREKHPEGLTEKQRKFMLDVNKDARKWKGWQTRLSGNIRVFVKGAVRHHEHKTLILRRWHEVVPNTEAESTWMRHMTFID